MTRVNNRPISKRTPIYHDPIWVLCVLIIVFGIILEPSTDFVSFLGYPLPEVCYVKRFFDISCLGCGLTRSVVFAFHFEFQTSLHMHIGGIPISIFAILYTIKILLKSDTPIDKA
jgi:hypothetical protein